MDHPGPTAAGPPPPPPPPPEDNVLTITHVVDSFVTYCPQPTIFTWEEEEYTATAPTHLTITNCPCTIEAVSNSPFCCLSSPPLT